VDDLIRHKSHVVMSKKFWCCNCMAIFSYLQNGFPP